MGSIRRSILLGTAIGVGLVLVTLDIALHRGVRARLIADFDRTLVHDARFLASVVEVNLDGIDHGFDELDAREFEDDRDRSLLAVHFAGGDLYYATSGGEDLPWTAADSTSPAIRALTIEAGPVRLVTLPFRPRIEIDEDEANPSALGESDLGRPLMVLSLARGTRRLNELTHSIGVFLVIVGTGAAGVLLLVLAIVIRRGLSPLDELASDIDRIDVDGSPSPLAFRRVPEEARRVVERLNEMIDRVTTALARERTFSVDVAHELRTPLAGLRSLAEVELSKTRTAESYRVALERSLDIVVRLQGVVETLLQLGRLEAGQVPLTPSRLRIAEQLEAGWSAVEAVAKSKRVSFESTVDPTLRLDTDRTLFDAAIRNLLENAVEYVNEGGRIDVVAARRDRGVVIRIVNTGSRVSEEEAATLTERFVRADRARGDTGRHAGLGLALVQRISTTLGMGLAVSSEVGGEFVATLSV